MGKETWLRTGVVASAVWLGGVIIYSVVGRDFYWHSGGPATISAIVGVAVIFAVCLGIPWIAAAGPRK